MWSDLERDYSSSSSAASDKKEKRVDLLGGWREGQTSLEILSPI